jgi:thiamine biosynthesis lipoprotein ApbE
MEFVCWFDLLREIDDRILERKQGAWIDLERQVEIKRPSATLLGMEVDFPGLAKGVGLDEMALVVHVEAVVDGMVLQVGHIAGDIDDSHSGQSLPGAQ